MSIKFRIPYQRISNPEHSRARTQNWDSFKIIEAPTADDDFKIYWDKFRKIWEDKEVPTKEFKS